MLCALSSAPDSPSAAAPVSDPPPSDEKSNESSYLPVRQQRIGIELWFSSAIMSAAVKNITVEVHIEQSVPSPPH